MNYHPRIRKGWYFYRAQDGTKVFVRVTNLAWDGTFRGSVSWGVAFLEPVTTSHTDWVWGELHPHEFRMTRTRKVPPEVRASVYSSLGWRDYWEDRRNHATARRAAS